MILCPDQEEERAAEAAHEEDLAEAEALEAEAEDLAEDRAAEALVGLIITGRTSMADGTLDLAVTITAEEGASEVCWDCLWRP